MTGAAEGSAKKLLKVFNRKNCCQTVPRDGKFTGPNSMGNMKKAHKMHFQNYV